MPTKKFFEYDGVCEDCKGTGVYQGMGEKDGAGIQCHTCNGTGCHSVKISYIPFEERKVSTKFKWVYPVNCGIVVGEKAGVCTYKDFGGQSYGDWLKGKPLPDKFEMRTFTCPAWYYQTFDWGFKPEWNECLGCGDFSSCKHFKSKNQCWERWDKKFGAKARLKREAKEKS